MAEATPNNTRTPLANVGVANLLRGMANDQKNQAHALAMGQAQLRQMMGDNWKDPAPESDPMKIAAGPINETTTTHFHFHNGSGKEGETAAPPGMTADPALGSTGGPSAGPSLAPSASSSAPSASSSARSSALWGLVRKMAPLVLASTLGAGGIVLGQVVQAILARSSASSSTSSAPSAPLPSPNPLPSPSPSPYRNPNEDPQITPPPSNTKPGAIIIHPDRPDLMWELDLGKPTGRE